MFFLPHGYLTLHACISVKTLSKQSLDLGSVYYLKGASAP